MITTLMASLAAFSLFGHAIISPIPGLSNPKIPLAEHQFSLANRYDNTYVNNVFKDNILLNIAYMDGKVTSKDGKPLRRALVKAWPKGQDLLPFALPRAFSGDSGDYRLEHVPEGTMMVGTGFQSKEVEVQAGSEVELDFKVDY